MADGLLLASLFLVLLLGLYALGVHVAFALGISSLLIMVLPIGPAANLSVVVQRLFSGLSGFILIAIPFFILAGRIMNESGLTDDLFDFAEELVGPIPGGLGHVSVVASMIFSGMSGSAVADAAGLGIIEYKAMSERGYKKTFAAGITGASATIGPIIPPSIPLIVYGVLANVSIGALFVAGIVPGILMGLSLMGMVLVLSLRSDQAVPVNQYSFSRLVHSFIRAIPAVLAPVIIVGGIITGFFTPTESAVVTSVYALLVGQIFYDGLSFQGFYSICRDTFTDSVVLLLIIGFANLYGYLLTLSGVPTFFSEQLLSISQSSTIIIILLVLLFLILGTFMETLAIILTMVPILAPIFPQVGIDPLSFGIIMMIALMIGIITPPFGVVLFTLDRVTDLEFEGIVRGVAPFYVPLIVILLLLILFPQITSVLPQAVGIGG